MEPAQLCWRCNSGARPLSIRLQPMVTMYALYCPLVLYIGLQEATIGPAAVLTSLQSRAAVRCSSNYAFRERLWMRRNPCYSLPVMGICKFVAVGKMRSGVMVGSSDDSCRSLEGES